jgi:hypothetical protein
LPSAGFAYFCRCSRRRWQSTAVSPHLPIGSGKAVITLLGQRNQNGPAAYEESFQAAQLRGRRMAAGAATGAAL